MINFEKFNKSFFQGFDKISWVGTDGILKIDDKRNVQIILSPAKDGIEGQYEGYNVIITNKWTGTIASKFFYFKHFLNKRDKHDEYIVIENTFDDNEVKWFETIPNINSIDFMANKIFEYINYWY